MIDIGAWPDSMFVSNLRMSNTTFMLLCGELGPFIRRSDTTAAEAISSSSELVTRLRSRLANNPRVHNTGGLLSAVASSVRAFSGVVCQR